MSSMKCSWRELLLCLETPSTLCNKLELCRMFVHFALLCTIIVFQVLSITVMFLNFNTPIRRITLARSFDPLRGLCSFKTVFPKNFIYSL